jgi:cell division protein FtsN
LPEIIAASPVTGWMVQLGSFSNSGNARRQAERVETYGHDARIYEFAAAGGRTMFRVRLGPLDSRERAEATASSLAANGFVAQLVAPE